MLIFYQTRILSVGEPAPQTDFDTTDSIEKALDLLVNQNKSVVLLNHTDEQLLSYLKNTFKFIQAAGGIVKTTAPNPSAYQPINLSTYQQPNNKYLLIYRNDHWDLPKGMVEPGEDIESAALREVQEETGISDLTLGPILATTFHIYNTYGDWTLKQTFWYLMTTPHPSETTPQTAEGITKAEWLTPDERHQALSHSYSMMKHLDSML